jgi:hypothetical protein
VKHPHETGRKVELPQEAFLAVLQVTGGEPED